MPKIADRLQNLAERSSRLGKELTAGISRREVARLFDEDARTAYRALSDDTPDKVEEADDFKRVLRQVSGFFVGFALKLSPARRLLFALCLLFPILGFVPAAATIRLDRLQIDFSPFWFMLSITGLTLLLALELVDRLRVRDELDVARQLQSDLLPHRAPELPGYRIAHSYRTANEIGGDYYDFLPLADGRIVLAVGDASGHGISAGLVMAITNATLKTAVDLDPDPQAVLAHLNRVLFRTGGKRAFMTLFCGVLDPATGDFEYAGAGHPFPLLRRAAGAVEELGRGSMPLGIRKDLEVRRDHTRIEPGDLLVLYSDGIPEAAGSENGDTFGFDRLAGLLAQPETPQVVHDRILRTLDRHLGDRAINDDLTLVVLDRAPELNLPAGGAI
ncbi:MAG: PP2C family protein-serine/threonine phosphatase [bacterium]|nr:PP2C family protein-serine/threonine phosphatase [bacterium]